jgi:hypothetical protein
VPKEKNRTNRIQRRAAAQRTTDGARAPAAVCTADDGRGAVRRIAHDHSAQFAAILCRSRCLFSVAKALHFGLLVGNALQLGPKQTKNV